MDSIRSSDVPASSLTRSNAILEVMLTCTRRAWLVSGGNPSVSDRCEESIYG